MRAYYSWRSLAALIVIATTIPSRSDGEGVDRYGDPVPDGAIARLGTIRLRHVANSTTGVAFSPDGKLIASATNNSPYIFVFDVATGRRVAQFGPKDPNAHLYWNGPSLAFEQDGKSLLVMNLLGGQVERLDLASDKRTPLKKPPFAPHATTASPDGSRVAISDPDGKVHVFAYTTMKPVAVLENSGPIDSLSFDGGGKLLAVGADKRKKFEVWNLEKKAIVWSKNGEGYDYQIRLSPSGKLIACTPGKSGFALFKIGQEEPIVQQSSGSSCKACRFSPDESTLLVTRGSSFEY